MSNKMLIDATHPEETRVVVVRNKRVEDFDFEAASKRPLRGNIYLAKVTRVEPSLQAAFVEYGGNRHGFLAFNEIHPDYYQIPQADRAALLAEERAEAREDEEAAKPKSRRRSSSSASSRRSRTATSEAASADEPNEELGGGGRDEAPDAGPSSDDEPATLDRAVQQVEENIEADVGTVHDGPAATVEVEVEDKDEPAVANEAPSDEADRDAPSPGDEDVRRASSEAAPEPEPDAAGETSTATSADAPGDKAEAAPAASADADRAPGGDEGEEPAPAPKRRRRSPSRTTKKSADGLDDPRVSDEATARSPDDSDDGNDAGSDEGSVTALGNTDALEEIPERRARAPRRNYKIQEVIKRRQILLIQVVKEERGTKGAALTTYLSLAGRYSVLMPNTDRGGGVSRKITDNADRKRLKSLVAELDVPEGMGIILRTAGAARTKTEIKRDFEYLLRLWESVRELTLKSIAPQLVYEEGNLVKRSIRDLYGKEIDEVLVCGDAAYREAKDFMRMLMPSHAKNVKQYREPTPIFTAYGVEPQLDAMFSEQVTLPSKGYIVINPTEALVSIDVNSGRSTKESSIEETATKTNLEAADEVARQLRLRDLAGLIVIDFIDMDDKRHNRAVEKRLKDALKLDRSRIQVGRISPFGLMEMSRQRIRQGMVESSVVPCAICAGTGHVRSTQSVALHCLRSLEEHLLRNADHHVMIKTSAAVALYILNQKRQHLNELEERFGLEIAVDADEMLSGQHLQIVSGAAVDRDPAEAPPTAQIVPDAVMADDEVEDEEDVAAEAAEEAGESNDRSGSSRGRRRRRRRRGGGSSEESSREVSSAAAAVDDHAADGRGDPAPVGDTSDVEAGDVGAGDMSAEADEGRQASPAEPVDATEADEEERPSRRRRGRRGGRRHRREDDEASADQDATAAEASDASSEATDDAVSASATDEQRAGTNGGTPSAAHEADGAEGSTVEGEAERSDELGPKETAAPTVDLMEDPPATDAPEDEATAAAPERAEAASEPPRPRRSGWWQRRSFF
ncbi:Rne/Rng family ribonuclease [Acuticoccus sp.]|uniref:Rne/Rng family ribonuclease n=1 Tax=Acuticoccus sp. TaxID=1904378 RepID=UPI003B51828B